MFELRNVIERLALLRDDAVLTARALGLPGSSGGRAAPGPAPQTSEGGRAEDARSVAEALAETGWNISQTARRLGVSRNTLRYWIEKHRLRPGAAVLNNLPGYLTAFVGREREIGEIRALLGTARLLTLTGAGGSGKTRLAVEVARRATAFPDGVWLADLAALGDASLVPQAVASAANVRDDPNRPLVEALAAALAPRRMLLVLDNCEHLAEACARLAARLLQMAPELRVLATSRQPLGTAGEVLWSVPAMALPPPDRSAAVEELMQSEAVRLFADRAAAARPGFAVGGHISQYPRGPGLA
jgi:transcriptional regulator with XRE-family HTH domain